MSFIALKCFDSLFDLFLMFKLCKINYSNKQKEQKLLKLKKDTKVYIYLYSFKLSKELYNSISNYNLCS